MSTTESHSRQYKCDSGSGIAHKCALLKSCQAYGQTSHLSSCVGTHIFTGVSERGTYGTWCSGNTVTAWFDHLNLPLPKVSQSDLLQMSYIYPRMPADTYSYLNKYIPPATHAVSVQTQIGKVYLMHLISCILKHITSLQWFSQAEPVSATVTAISLICKDSFRQLYSLRAKASSIDVNRVLLRASSVPKDPKQKQNQRNFKSVVGF